MSCYLEYKEAINNLKSDIKKSGYKDIPLGKFINTNAFTEHNNKVAQEVKKIQTVVDKWDKWLPKLGIKGSVVERITRPFQGDVDSKVGFTRKVIDIVYNENILNKIDDFRKSLGIYDSKLSYASYLEEQSTGKVDKQYQKLSEEERNNNQNSLFGLDTQNQQQLEFHINTLNVVGQFLENIGIEQRLIPEFLSQDGSIVEGAIAASNFIEGTVDIIDDLEKRPSAWNKLPEEAAHWWYRLLDTNSPLKKALWESHQTALKNDELYKGQYGKLVSKPEDLTEESIGQLIAEAIKRIETKNANASDYSFFKKFLEWINSIIDIFKNTKQDPFEVAAMKILSSDMSDLMTWEEYRKINNIVNFADVLTEQSVAPIDYTLIEDIGVPDRKATKDNPNDIYTTYTSTHVLRESSTSDKIVSPEFNTRKELDNWVYQKYGKLINQRQKEKLQEVRDNQEFFDRLLNKTARKKSKFLPKTLKKYYNIIDAQNLNKLREWNISQELQQITKKLSDVEKQQIIQTNGYTNIAPTLKVLPDLLQKYRKNPIVLSEPIKIDGAKKQELSILNGIREMIKLENPNLKSITAEEFIEEVHNWLKTNYLLGFANENSYLSYRTDQTFSYLSDRQTNEDVDITNLTEEELQRLPFEERQRIANIVGLTKQNPDVYHNKVSLRFNDMYHLKSGHFDKSPSAWGNLTYFYSGKNKWKDAVLLHEIQNDNIEFLREFKAEKVDLETSLGRYLQQLNTDLLDNIQQIESGGKRIQKDSISASTATAQQLPSILRQILPQIEDLPLEQGLNTLKQRLNELIELYKSDNSVRNNPEKAQEQVEKAYSQRRIFQDFQKRGGIKSLLSKEELDNLKEILQQLNTEEIMTESVYLPEENQYEPGYPTIRDLKEKKKSFKNYTNTLQIKINNKLKELYGDNAPTINLNAPAKPLPKAQRNTRLVRRGGEMVRIGNVSQQLNENVNFLIAFSEQQINKQLSKNIEESKNNYIQARNATNAYNFNVSLSKITQEQYNNLIENYKYNQDLLNRLIDEQAQKDIQKESIDISKLSDEEIIKDITGEYEEPNEIDQFPGSVFQYRNMYLSLAADTKEKAVQEIRERYDPNNQKNIQKSKYEVLKQKALDKKAELEKNYGKIEEEVKQTLEIEMNYFTPLVHHLIQKHINQYGKDFPMYFSGYNITKLTQGNDRTALIYAGKDEINIVNISDFKFNDKEYIFDGSSKNVPLAFTIKSKENGEVQYRKINNEYSVRDNGALRDITEQEYNKAKQEYEKAYQQATERRAKEIKFIAAANIGIIKFSDFEGTIQGLSEDTNVKKLSDKQLEEGIKKLNEYKKQSKQNLDRVINTIMNISGNKPIETGAIYNAMSQISGVKLVWQDKIDGLQGNTGGYLVDLSNYNYNVPILYALEKDEEKLEDTIVVFEPEQIHILSSKADIEGFKEFVGKPKAKEQGKLLSLKSKTEVERILTEGDVQVKQLVTKPIEEVKLDKVKKPEVIKKMKEILNILGIKTEISNLPEEIAAQADILNRLIKFANDSITEDNFTEETIHFIVEILEQKNKPLFDKMMSEIWKYKIYTNVKNEYSSLKQYQNENGRPNYYKIKKEAIGQLLTAKLLDTQEVKDEKNFIGGIWEAISKFIKSLFTSISNQKRDAFQTTVDEILGNPELIKQEDVQFLGQSSVFFSKRPSNKIASSLYKVKQKFGTASQTQFNKFNNNEEAWEYFKNLDSRIEKVTEKELNTQTNEYEDVEYYVFDGNKKQRVTTVIKEANNKTFANVSQDEQAQALREAKRQKGTEVHKTIEDILNRYIDANTGEIRTTPLNRPLNLNIPKTAYDKLENHVQNRLATYPKGTKFLMETKVVNEEAGYAGTIDFLAFLPNGEVDILDWKTTDVSYWEAGIKRKRFDISPFNQTYWKTQLSFYKRALESHGVDDFRYTRAIPIALETKQTLIDKNKKYTPDNVIYQISNIEVGDSEPKKISKDLFYLTPVSVEDESTGIKELDELIDKLQGIYDRIQKTTYSKEEAYKKKQELDRLNLAIREIQTKRTATFFTNLFTENFERFEKLTDKEFEFLKDVKGKKLLSQEQEQQLHNYLNEVYSAIEFLQAFQDFPGVIGELYKEGELTDYEKEVKKAAVSIGGKAQTIGNQLIKNATSVIDQLGQLYNIDNTSGLDRKDTGLFTNFISILHREEKSIQFAARLLNAIKFLGNKEANEFFNEETGKYTLVYNAVQEWMKKNKKSLEDTYSLLLNKDKEGKPVRELLSKIKSEFFTELQTKQTEFTEYYKSQQELLSDLGYKGTKYVEELNKTYKKHVESWLSSNFNISEYEKSYKEALEKYKESNKNVRLDEDDLINEEKKRKRLESWIEEHDVFSSPKALSPRNYLLYPNLNESKWYSEGYKNLLKPENKPLLDAYNLFTELNKRAEDNGMLDDIINSRRFVPNVVDPSLSRSAFEILKEGGMSPFYAISKITEFFQRHLGFLKEVEAVDPQLDPLTKKQLRRIPVRYKYIQASEIEREEGETIEEFQKRKEKLKKESEKDLSNDLFEIYAKWADHIIRYEMLSNYENRFKMVQLLESIKSKSFAVNNIGEIIRKKDKAGLKTKKLDITDKSSNVELDLQKLINNYIYSSNLDIKPEFYKIANALYDYTALKSIGFNLFSAAYNFTGGGISAKALAGKWFSETDYNHAELMSMRIWTPFLKKYGKNIIKKSDYLVKEFQTRIVSEFDTELLDKYKNSKNILNKAAFYFMNWGDHGIQDSVAKSIFLNTTIIDGKFVNINDLVKAKYNSKIFDTKLSSQERAKLRKQRDKEIQELKEKSNLYRFVEEKNGKFSFKGIDLNSLEGKAQLLSYQNTIAHYIKQAIGNMDSFDKSVAGMDWYMKFLFQFKRWMPRLSGSRYQDLEYQYELNDYHYGRSRIFFRLFLSNTFVFMWEFSKNLKSLLPYVKGDINSASIIDIAKAKYLEKKIKLAARGQKMELTEDQFVDIYTNQLRKAFDFTYRLMLFSYLLSFISLSGGGDDEDSWILKILSRYLFGVAREMGFDTSPEQLTSFFGKNVVPVIGTMADVVSLIDTYYNEAKGSIEQKLPDVEYLNSTERAEKLAKRAKPVSKTIEMIPFMNQLHYFLSAKDVELPWGETYNEFLEIQPPKTQTE